MSALVHLLACLARYWLDPAYRDECDLEDALADEGEDGQAVARVLARMRGGARRPRRAAVTRHSSLPTEGRAR